MWLKSDHDFEGLNIKENETDIEAESKMNAILQMQFNCIAWELSYSNFNKNLFQRIQLMKKQHWSR